MVPLTGLEPVLNCFRQILSLLCLPFHHSGANLFLIPPRKIIPCRRDVQEGCRKTKEYEIEKVG